MARPPLATFFSVSAMVGGAIVGMHEIEKGARGEFLEV